MEERYIATADIGSSKIALTIARTIGDRMEILYYKETASAGIRYSCVFNPKKAAGKLREAIDEAEQELGIKITQLIVGKPRYSIQEQTAKGKTERTDAASCITQEEIYVVKNFAIDDYDKIENPEKEIIYGAVPQSFCTDDNILLSEEDVIGMPSRYLEGNFKIFIGSKKALTNIDTVLNELGIAQAGMHFLPDATARAVLSQDELENGVALIEMGGGVTSLSIYKGDILRHYSAIPFGGKNITADIRYECGISESLAENIKLAYGGCLPDRLQSLGDKIIQINDDLDSTQQQIPVKDLSAIITARAEEIINAMLYKIQESGLADKLRCGIVLCGGGAEMTNLALMVKEMSGYNVRIGYPKLRQFSTEGMSGIGAPSAAASIGLLMLAKKDTRLNCITEVKVRPDHIKEPEPENIQPSWNTPENTVTTDAPETMETMEKEPVIVGTVFEDAPETAGTTDKRGGRDKQKEKKRKSFIWTKVTEGKIGDLVDKVGDIFVGLE